MGLKIQNDFLWLPSFNMETGLFEPKIIQKRDVIEENKDYLMDFNEAKNVCTTLNAL
jgi:hypothetical protein